MLISHDGEEKETGRVVLDFFFLFLLLAGLVTYIFRASQSKRIREKRNALALTPVLEWAHNLLLFLFSLCGPIGLASASAHFFFNSFYFGQVSIFYLL